MLVFLLVSVLLLPLLKVLLTLLLLGLAQALDLVLVLPLLHCLLSLRYLPSLCPCCVVWCFGSGTGFDGCAFGFMFVLAVPFDCAFAFAFSFGLGCLVPVLVFGSRFGLMFLDLGLDLLALG